MIRSILIIIVLCLMTATGLAQSTGKEKICFLTYGYMPRPERARVQYEVAEKWGMEFYNVGDCDPGQRLIDSVKHFNSAGDKIMAARYGKHWNEKFWAEVDALYATPEVAEVLVIYLDFIRRQDDALRKSADSLRYTWTPTTQKGVYNVLVSGSVKNIIFYKLLVDYPRNKVSILNR